MSYDMIDRFLRNNLGDDDYANYSDALNALCTPQRTWVGLTDEELVRSDEREQCAKVCETHAPTTTPTYVSYAAAIRARSNT